MANRAAKQNVEASAWWVSGSAPEAGRPAWHLNARRTLRRTIKGLTSPVPVPTHPQIKTLKGKKQARPEQE